MGLEKPPQPAPADAQTAPERPDRSPARFWFGGGLAAVLVGYLVTFLWLPHDGFWITDNEAKFIQVQGLLRTNYRDFSIPWPGQELDPEFAFNPLRDPFSHIVNGRMYGFNPPAFLVISKDTFSLLPPASATFLEASTTPSILRIA